MANSRATTNGTSTRGGGAKSRGQAASAAANNSHQQIATARETTAVEQKPNPLDFDSLPLSALRKYRSVYKLSTPSASSFNGYLLNSAVGKKTYTSKHNSRVNKQDLATTVKRHFMNTNIKESETIVDFIYSVRKQDQEFKLQFRP